MIGDSNMLPLTILHEKGPLRWVKAPPPDFGGSKAIQIARRFVDLAEIQLDKVRY